MIGMVLVVQVARLVLLNGNTCFLSVVTTDIASPEFLFAFMIYIFWTFQMTPVNLVRHMYTSVQCVV